MTGGEFHYQSGWANHSMYASEQSDRSIVPEKPLNKGSSIMQCVKGDIRAERA